MPENKVYEITVTIGVAAEDERIAKLRLADHLRYMTVVHPSTFIDSKLDICVERGSNTEPMIGG